MTLVRPMRNWLHKLLGIHKPAAVDEEIHGLRNKVQTLRLELSDKLTAISTLSRELDRQRDREIDSLSEKLSALIEDIISDVSTPAIQLITQAHLLEAESKPLQARDVLAVAKRLIRTLEDRGMKVEGAVGDTVPFDPNFHMSLSGRSAIGLGEPVIIRLVGISYKNKVIRKAGVEPCRDA